MRRGSGELGLLLGLLLALTAGGAARAEAGDAAAHFQYRRAVPAPATGTVCATLDAAVYAHAASSLKDVRLLGRTAEGARFEVPYVLTLNEAAPVLSETARLLNVGRRGGRLVFDLAMPARAYSDVVLDLDGRDFVGTATVSGRAAAAAAPVEMGEFTVFDLSSQHLARSTTLHLQESTFPLLHVELAVHGATGGGTVAVSVKGAGVPPSREAQTLYAAAASTGAIEQRGRESVARMHLPARVPVERVRVAVDPGFAGNFSRDVVVKAHTAGASAEETERLEGRVERVRMTRGGVVLESAELSLPATLGANLQEDAEVEVAVENGDDPPLPLTGVALEMRRRSLCFEARGGGGLELLYGDASLSAPVYDYARTFAVSVGVQTVALGAEERNPLWRERADTRVFTERHPHLLYLALLGAVCALAVVAFRSGKVQHRRHR